MRLVVVWIVVVVVRLVRMVRVRLVVVRLVILSKPLRLQDAGSVPTGLPREHIGARSESGTVGARFKRLVVVVVGHVDVRYCVA